MSVQDSGLGIPKAFHQRIFEPFFKVPTDPGEAQLGAGTGLAIARAYIRVHKGRIRVKSKGGQGSTFLVLLPFDTA